MATSDNVTDNVNIVSLSVVKQGKVPVEENFSKIYITQSEQKSCCVNCIINLDNFDKKISQPLQRYTPNLFIELFFLIFAKSFNTLTVILYLVLILFYSIFIAKNINIFLIPLIHVIIGSLITLILKKIIGRERPILSVKKYFEKVRTRETMESMPSGDSLQSANFAFMIIFYFEKKIKFFSLCFIPLSMIGRVFYCCHYWFDCFVGGFLGIITSYGSYFIINKFNLNRF